MKRFAFFWTIGVIFVFGLLAGCNPSLDESAMTASTHETVIVAQASDPYYALAQKIAQSEKLEIVAEFTEAFAAHPKFILWVAAPKNITPEKLLDIGRIFKDTGDYPALGILSASTLESAEQLWARRGLAHAGSNYVGGDTEVNQQISEPAIIEIHKDANKKIKLNKDNLIEALKEADYFYWARHVGEKTWYWNSENEASENWGENDQLFAGDIPPLKALVIYTPSCGSFRPWVNNSIALGFIDQGAAAYIGNVNPPMTNAFIKRGLAVPGISSWEGFPLGLVAQVQNKMAARTFFSIPQFFMLGDPRLYLSENQPYRIISDTAAGNGKRVIRGESNEQGMLALKIENGAQYDFLAIKGLTSASEGDLFYNSKLQTLNLGADKYVLFLHEGGAFEIELSVKAPFLWSIGDSLVDALDYSWVMLWLDEKIIVSVFVYFIPLLALPVFLLYKTLFQKRPLKDYRNIFLAALLLTALHLVYFLLRVDKYTISANYVNITALHIVLGCSGKFACIACGLILMRDAKKLTGRILGFVFAVLPQFLLVGFYLAFITLMNIATPVNKMTSPWLWNYHAFWLPLIVLALESALVLGLWRFAVNFKK